ncbi:hypothetical protein [Cupriavidus metallidurans]|uniref:Uncharacterized protein n=1 Tax=Cupriavidus metallidurans TaxID=119219 RepID=A0A482IRY9_9BURK|nr:hypothetical protein [Cupriavidus metallidurans]QBP09824.1 hypothetical protein DDF84_008655 [Cupriavidus metallidurans]
MAMPRHLRDDPVFRELRAGIGRVVAEVRRTLSRIETMRALRALDREEKRASREIDWMRKELDHAEANLVELEQWYRTRRKDLTARLKLLSGDAA